MSPRVSFISLTLRQLGLSVLVALLVFGGAAVAAPGVASATPAQTLPFEQLGIDIDGENTGDLSGYAVALSGDGTTLAIGAPFNDGGDSSVGHVRVYTLKNGTAWLQQGGDIDGEAAGDESGYAVALSGDGTTLAIGAPFNDGNDSSAGHVRVYSWNGSAWGQQGGDIDGEAAGDRSGAAVALSADGKTLAVGAPGEDNGNDDNVGHVRVYTWNGAAWGQQGGDINGEAAGDYSGNAVALSADGKTLAISAPYNDNGNGDGAGHVRVYTLNNGGAWVQRGGDIDGEAAGDYSGFAVALSADGKTLAIGAPRNDNGNDDRAGHVRVYTWNSANWVQQGGDINGEAAGDRSGAAVALSDDGTNLAIGAYGNDDRAGHVRVYTLENGAWGQLGLDIDGEAAGDESGAAVALSADGTTLAIGAPYNGSDAGQVRVYLVETVAPATTLVSGPSGTVTSSDASFRFSANEASTFSCKLDSGSYASCTSPTSYSGLAEGGHTFRVRATDRAGNVDASPAVRSWTVSFPEFKDSQNSVFAGDIGRLAAAGITKGCNPPTNDRFCPDDNVTRGQMAAFLTRALSLPAATEQFRDVDTTDTFAAPIGALAKAGITKGCNPPTNDRFCPDDFVTRGQMAAFLVRAGLAD
jgi:hypothetical protein